MRRSLYRWRPVTRSGRATFANALAIVGIAFSQSFAAAFEPGDINDDGVFDVADTVVLRRELAGLGPGISQMCVAEPQAVFLLESAESADLDPPDTEYLVLQHVVPPGTYQTELEVEFVADPIGPTSARCELQADGVLRGILSSSSSGSSTRRFEGFVTTDTGIVQVRCRAEPGPVAASAELQLSETAKPIQASWHPVQLGPLGTCGNPILLSLSASVFGTTAGATNDHLGSCLAADGPDLVFAFFAPSGGSFDVAEELGNLALYVQFTCGDPVSEGFCVQPGASVNFGLFPDQTAYIVLDEQDQGPSAYSVSVSSRF